MKKRIFAALLSVVVLVGIVLPIAPKAVGVDIEEDWTLGVDMWSFNSWTDYYYGENGKTDPKDKLREVEDVLASGYVNHMMVSYDENFKETLELCKKYDIDIWLSSGFFYSNRQTIDNYMLNVEEKVNDVVEAGMWDNFLGFYWDEPFLNSMTNDDYLLMTKSLFEKWGKRNYPVFGQVHFVDGYDVAEGKEKIEPYALEYTTDVSWDNYSYDVREEAKNSTSQNNALKKNSQTLGVELKTAEEYYRYIHSELMEKIDHDVYVWFHPTAWITSTWIGGRADEGYCIGHLEFFLKLLNEQEHPGGITLYSYASWSYPGIEQYLVVPNLETGEQLLYPDVPKWKEYSQDIKNMVKSFRKRKLTTLEDGPFGHLNVLNKTANTISIQAEKGYTYSINGGAFKSTDKFTGLKENTTYTITVKRTADGRTKSFDVTTEKAHGIYGTGKNDTAKYIMKMPTGIEAYTATYGHISTNISRDRYDKDWYKNSNGEYTSGGYIHIKKINGERMLELNNNGQGDANTQIYFKFGDAKRSTYDNGITDEVYTNKLAAFAIRTKITGAARSSNIIVDAMVSNARPKETEVQPIKFVHKSTGKITELEYDGGIKLTGNVDGWIIIPFEAYPDLDDDAATTNLDYFRKELTSIQLWQRGEDWGDMKWYVGDMFVLEDTEAFAAAQTGKTATVKPESSSSAPASDNNDNNNNNDTSSQKPSDDPVSSKVEADDDVSSNTQSSAEGNDNTQGDDDQSGGGEVEYEYYIPDYVWYIVAAGAAVVIAAAVVTIIVVKKKRAKAATAVAVFGDETESEQIAENQSETESTAEPETIEE